MTTNAIRPGLTWREKQAGQVLLVIGFFHLVASVFLWIKGMPVLSLAFQDWPWQDAIVFHRITISITGLVFIVLFVWARFQPLLPLLLGLIWVSADLILNVALILVEYEARIKELNWIRVMPFVIRSLMILALLFNLISVKRESARRQSQIGSE